MAPFFPQIDPRSLASLLTVKQQLDSNPDYLKEEDCPYDEDTVADLTMLLAPKVIERIVEVEKVVEVEKRIEAAASSPGKRGPKQKGIVLTDEITSELKDIREDLRQLKTDQKNLSPGDRVMILKTRSLLVEKLAVLAEKNTNIKRMNMFMSTVMTVLDDLVPSDQKQEFIRRIEPFAESE